jgi:hypothetical protein
MKPPTLKGELQINCKPFKLDNFIEGILRTQDMTAWKAKPPAEFDAWLKKQIHSAIDFCTAEIVTVPPRDERILQALYFPCEGKPHVVEYTVWCHGGTGPISRAAVKIGRERGYDRGKIRFRFKQETTCERCNGDCWIPGVGRSTKCPQCRGTGKQKIK